MVSVSGITPSGRLTLGNHLGALRRFASRGDSSRDFFFVADLHAMTTKHDPRRLRALTRETATLMLAAGLPEATVFIQSAVPAHAQLGYLLECTAYVGELSRMIQYKEKGRGRPMTRASLFTYPCLMAADILLYGAERVPVGGDQDQHVELARDVAVRFNREYGETFVVPQLDKAALAARIKDLQQPTTKMSKSDVDDATGVIRLLDPVDVVRRQVMRAVTDSGSEVRHDAAAKPGVTNLLEILAACTDDDPVRAGHHLLVVRRAQAGRRGRRGRGAGAAAAPVRRARGRPGHAGRPVRRRAGPGGRGSRADTGTGRRGDGSGTRPGCGLG